MINTLSVNAIIPHKNLIFDFKQIQKFFLDTKTGKRFFPFYPFFIPISDESAIEKINPPLYFFEPLINEKWLYIPVSCSLKDEGYVQYSDIKNDRGSITIAELPPLPQGFCIPLAFTLDETSEACNSPEMQHLALDSVTGSYGKITFPIKARIFRTAKLEFSWPLNNESVKQLENELNYKLPEQLPYAFNWTLSENKWKK